MRIVRFANRRWMVLAVVAVINVGATATAQSPICDRTKSANDCFSLQSNAAKLQAKAAATKAGTKAVTEETAAKPTGSAAAVSGSETAIKDFLPRFATALAIPGLSATPKALGLSFNTTANDPVWRSPFAIKLEGAAVEPKLSDALVNNIPLARRPTVKDSVTQTLGDFVDVKASLALNLERKSWGRSIASSKEEIDDIMGAMFTGDMRNLIISQEPLVAVLGSIAPLAKKECNADDVAKLNMPLDCFSTDDQERIEHEIVTLSEVFNDFSDRAKLRLKQTHLDRISDLVNGQPQFSMSADARFRDYLVGANEQATSLRLEWSPVSLNAARDFCKGRLAFTCLQTYLAQDGIVQALDAGHRFWFTADFSNISAYSYKLEADSASVTKPRSLAIEPAIGYGSYLGVSDQKVRLDFELRYRHSDDQTVRQNRITSSLTLTQKVSDQSNGVFTIRWANKADYLGDVAKKWRANLGYSYKVSDIGK